MSGSTLRRWLSKVATLVSEEACPSAGGSAPCVHICLPTHWRALVWACGTWLAGGAVVLGSPPDTTRYLEAAPSCPAPQVSVAAYAQDLWPQAQAQVLTPLASLALRWPGDLPPLTIDGAAELMAYPDSFSPPQTCDQDLALVAVGPQPRQLSRARLTELITPTGSPPQAALLVQEPTLAQALTACLRAWAAGRQAVLLPWQAPTGLVEAAMRQERALRH